MYQQPRSGHQFWGGGNVLKRNLRLVEGGWRRAQECCRLTIWYERSIIDGSGGGGGAYTGSASAVIAVAALESWEVSAGGAGIGVCGWGRRAVDEVVLHEKSQGWRHGGLLVMDGGGGRRRAFFILWRSRRQIRKRNNEKVLRWGWRTETRGRSWGDG